MKELNKADDILYNKGYILENMAHDKSYYELVERKDGGKVVIDYLSVAQVVALAAIL